MSDLESHITNFDLPEDGAYPRLDFDEFIKQVERIRNMLYRPIEWTMIIPPSFYRDIAHINHKWRRKNFMNRGKHGCKRPRK